MVRDRLNPAAENELVSYGFEPPGGPGSIPFIAGLGDDGSLAPVVVSHPGSPTVPAGLPFVAWASMASNLASGENANSLFDQDVFTRSFTSARLSGPLANAGELARFDFGDAPVGVSGNVRSVPLTADPFGFGPLLVLGAATSADSTAFTVTTSQCGAVQPAGLCLVSVQFRPILLGLAVPGFLDVTYDTNPLFDETRFERTDPIVVEVALVGRGVATAPTVVLNPNALAFGAITIGTLSPPATVNVAVTSGSNVFTVPAVFGDIRIAGLNPGDYQLDASGCVNVPLPAGGSCPIVVRFSPTARSAPGRRCSSCERRHRILSPG